MICTCFNGVLCCMRRRPLMKRLVLLLNLCMIEDGIMASRQDLIDKDHLAKYPYCGSMYYEGTRYSTGRQGCMPNCIGRAVNANRSTSNYRWLVVLEKRNMNVRGIIRSAACTGSVITER